MKRRKFLKLFGLGVGAVIAPTLAISKNDTAKMASDLANTPAELGLSSRGYEMEDRGTIPSKYLVVHINGLTWSVPTYHRGVLSADETIPLKMLLAAEAVYDPFSNHLIKFRGDCPTQYSFMVEEVLFPKMPDEMYEQYTLKFI